MEMKTLTGLFFPDLLEKVQTFSMKILFQISLLNYDRASAFEKIHQQNRKEPNPDKDAQANIRVTACKRSNPGAEAVFHDRKCA